MISQLLSRIKSIFQRRALPTEITGGSYALGSTFRIILPEPDEFDEWVMETRKEHGIPTND